MFNYDALKHPLKVERSDTWLFSHLMLEHFYQKLQAHYPEQGFAHHFYQPDNPNELTVHHDFDYIEVNHLENFHPLWKTFYEAIISKTYLDILGQLTALDLSNAQVKLWFVRYHKNGYMSPHYDRQPNKMLTQIFYFNDNWTASEGGYFNILTSTEPRKKIFSVLPDKIYSNVVKCNASAWHEVTPVRTNRIRKTVNIEYMAC